MSETVVSDTSSTVRWVGSPGGAEQRQVERVRVSLQHTGDLSCLPVVQAALPFCRLPSALKDMCQQERRQEVDVGRALLSE